MGSYQFVTVQKTEGHHVYRLGHPLAQEVVRRAKERTLRPVHLIFDYSNHPGTVGGLRELRGRSGWLQLTRLTVHSLEEEDRLLFAAIDEERKPVHPEIAAKLFQVGGDAVARIQVEPTTKIVLDTRMEELRAEVLQEIQNRNNKFFEQELDKLERWADDLKNSLELQLRDLKAEIGRLDKESRLAVNLQAKLELQKQKKELERQRKDKQRDLYEAEDAIDVRKGELLDEVEQRLKQKVNLTELFTIRWEVR